MNDGTKSQYHAVDCDICKQVSYYQRFETWVDSNYSVSMICPKCYEQLPETGTFADITNEGRMT